MKKNKVIKNKTSVKLLFVAVYQKYGKSIR